MLCVCPIQGPGQGEVDLGQTPLCVGGISPLAGWAYSGARPVVLSSSSPVLRGGVEPLERLRRPVQADHPRAEALGAAGAPERRGALPAPGGESRLPGVLDAAGPGLRARLR